MLDTRRRIITYFHLIRKICYIKQIFQFSDYSWTAYNVVSARKFSVNSWTFFWACAWEVIFCHFYLMSGQLNLTV